MKRTKLLYEQIKQSIKNDISKGKYSIGDRLPSERELAESFSVSRITVQRSLLDLQQEGILEKQDGRKGLFIPNYKKNFQKQTSLVAVVIDDVRESFGAEIFRGIEDYLWSKKIHTVICDVDRDFQKVEEYFFSLLKQNISGVVFAPVIDIGYQEKNKNLLSILDKAKIPYVLIDRYIPGILTNYVGTNHYESSKQMTKYLLSKGFRRILLASGLECSSMSDRKRGYIDAHIEMQIPTDPSLIISINENLLHGPESIETLNHFKNQISKIGIFDSFYALNDRLLEAGMHVIKNNPNICFVSHNKVESANFPGFNNLPHFKEPTYAMGREAARLMLDTIKHPSPMVVQKILVCDFISEPII